MEKEQKNCPFCGEEILAIAKKCKHCGEMLKNNQGASLIGELEALRNRNKNRGNELEKILNSPSPSMKLVYLTLIWFFGILFILFGLMMLVKTPLAGITMISASLLILPPARNFIYTKTKKELPFAAMSLIAIVLFIMSLAMNSPGSHNNLATTNSFTYSQKAPKLSAEEKQRRADNTILKTIWIAWHNIPGNAADDRNEKGRIIKRGTVPSSAMITSVEGRLPAYLACYDYIDVLSIAGMTGDFKANICIYYINNPTMGRSAMQSRGKKYIEKLEEFMRDDGFVEG